MRAMAGSWLLALAIGGASPDGQLHVTLYRSWLAPNMTVVNGLFRVDGPMLGTGPACEYRVRLAVEDTAGTRLVSNEWDGRCPPPRQGRPAGALETFQFAVLPAHYTVRVSVEAKDRPASRLSIEVPLESLPVETLASDLILASQVGWVDAAGEAQWTIRKGELGIAANSEAVALEANPSIAYYLEVYASPEDPLTGTLTGAIRRLDGLQIAQMKLQSLDSVVQPRPLAGTVSLEGLAPGDYVLETRLDAGDSVLVRTHAFRLEGTPLGQPAAPVGSGWFWELDNQRLEELFDPVLATLQKQSDRDLYQRLNPEGRRRFLAQYFGVSAPAREEQDKNALNVYLERVEQVNRQFTGRTGEPAWRTDRGRIWLLRGEPQARVARPLPPVGAAPYEIWQFTASPGYAYVFVDESRVGSYRLIWSSDPNEASLPDWERRLSPDAVDELLRLGIRPRGG